MIRVTEQPCAGPNVIACRLCRLRAPATWRSFDLVNIERELADHAQVLAQCDFVTAPSQFVADLIYQWARRHPVVIYNSVDASPAPPRPASFSYMLFASRPTSHKGYNLVLSAFAQPELRNSQLRVAADAPPVKARNVTILGRQLPNRLPELMAHAACVVVPSVWPEPFGLVVVEAFACGTPVVASRIGGIPELVDEGVTGLLVPPGDVKALASAIRRCCEDEKLQASARYNGPVIVKERFSLDAVVLRFESLYSGARL